MENLRLISITDNILLVKQLDPPFQFSCCDGLIILPKEGRNSELIVLDANIEPRYVKEIIKRFGPISHYINSHGHLDHIAHVHGWESEGAQILAPESEGENLLNLKNFYNYYGFNEGLDFSEIQKFGKRGKYQRCKNISTYSPGDGLKINNVKIKTVPLSGHSTSHVGFYLEDEGIFHISCLGYDLQKPEGKGFGPWYGFKQCSIEQYYKDIDKAEDLFLNRCEYLTSSHSYVMKDKTKEPFEYMRRKISMNHQKVLSAIGEHNFSNLTIDECAKKLLELDLFFPKLKMKGFMKEIYTFWEFWILKNHILFGKKNNHLN